MSGHRNKGNCLMNPRRFRSAFGGKFLDFRVEELERFLYGHNIIF